MKTMIVLMFSIALKRWLEHERMKSLPPELVRRIELARPFAAPFAPVPLPHQEVRVHVRAMARTS